MLRSLYPLSRTPTARASGQGKGVSVVSQWIVGRRTTADPSPTVALVVLLAVVVAVLASVFAIGMLSPTGPGSSLQSLGLRVQTCPTATNITFNGTAYTSCNATLYWSTSFESPQQMFAVQRLATVLFEGVSFNISGYNTVDCSVVDVTGREPTGATYSFLVYPVPVNCQFTEPTVFAPDNYFGATWTGGNWIQVLVRAT